MIFIINEVLFYQLIHSNINLGKYYRCFGMGHFFETHYFAKFEGKFSVGQAYILGHVKQL